MATPSPSPLKSRRVARRAAAVLAALFALAAAAALGGALWFYLAARSALPQLDGALRTAGLSQPVTVTRDRIGVPHITAANLDDLYFAQGYVTAQDRLWQMDITRRYSAGEMSEILGEDLLEHDREQRVLGMSDLAERAAAALPARERAHLEAYARGVNAYIEARRDSLPMEFRVLRYAPRPWRPADSMLVSAHMSKLLNFGTVEDLLAREKIAARIGPELAADLFPNSSWRDRPPASMAAPVDFSKPEPQETPSRGRPGVGRESPRAVKRAGTREPADDPVLVPGSNNWVISGAHTVSGKPLLSNDMHLPHEIPNIWYEAHLRCSGCVQREGEAADDLDVAGVTLPGVPYVIVGHNRRIAWGFTNIGPTVTDLYIETFNRAGEYQTPSGWKQPERRREIIHVKRKPDAVVDVTITRHGPIISSILPGETRTLALKWTLYDLSSPAIPFFDVNTARNWEEFRQALRRFSGPAQNVVYADVDGHIGYQAAGFIPIRAPEKNGPAPDAGLVPVPGNNDANEWLGYVPFDELPRVYDPPSGILATANGRMTPDGYRYTLAHEWGAPYRTERIYKVLASGKKFSSADMLALQTDVYSEFDRFCAQRFVYAVDHNRSVSQRARQAADLMRAWDGQVRAESAAPAIVAAARRELTRMILQPKVGDEWKKYRWYMRSVAIENMLLRKPERWLPPNVTSWDDLLASAVEAAVANKEAPRDLNSWRWGKEAPLFIEHPVFGRIPVLRRWAGPGRKEESGNGFTVKQVGRTFGPSERLTVDFSDLDQSTLNTVTGQSGNVFSPHFQDQWNAWYSGNTFPLPFSEAAIKNAAVHELRLEPK